MENDSVKFTVNRLERCVSATFTYGEDSLTSPYYSVYFIVNNSGIVAVSDKSQPAGNTDGDHHVFIDQMRTASMELKSGVNKYEVLQVIYDEMGRIGDKLESEGRPLLESDVSKLMTKLGAKYKK